MMFRYIALFSLVFGQATLAQEENPFLCNEDDDPREKYFGDFQEYTLIQEFTFEGMVKEIVTEYAEELVHTVNLEESYKGPNEVWIPRIIDLLDDMAGYKNESSCLWNHYKEGDKVYSFKEHSALVRRLGFVLIREGKAISYFYTTIGVV